MTAWEMIYKLLSSAICWVGACTMILILCGGLRFEFVWHRKPRKVDEADEDTEKKA